MYTAPADLAPSPSLDDPTATSGTPSPSMSPSAALLRARRSPPAKGYPHLSLSPLASPEQHVAELMPLGSCTAATGVICGIDADVTTNKSTKVSIDIRMDMVGTLEHLMILVNDDPKPPGVCCVL